MARRRLTLDSLILLAALVALLVDRARLLALFAFRYTDHDQTLLWYTVREVLQGRFHEPCFYGQAYNPPAEAWLAAPLVALGVPVWIALPLITSITGVLPYLLLAGLAWWRRHTLAATLMLLVPLSLPYEYAMITAIPRGFVIGIAIGTISCVLWMFSSRAGFAIAGFLAVLGITLCPNAVLLVAPMALYAIARHGRNRGFYLFTALGVVLALPAPIGITWFYAVHPDSVVHRPPGVWFSLTHWLEVVRHLDLVFGDFEPLVNVGWLFLIVFAAIVGLLVWLRHWPMAVAGGAGLVGTVLSLGISRVDLEFHSTLLPTSRFFLAVPVLLTILILQIALRTPLRLRQVVIPLALLAGILMVVRQATLETSIARTLQNPYPIYFASIDELHQTAAEVERVADACDASLLIIPMYEHLILNYSLPVLTDGRIETLFAQSERRTWRVREEASLVRPRLMLDTLGRPDLREGVARIDPAARMLRGEIEILCFDPHGRPAVEVMTDLGLKPAPQPPSPIDPMIPFPQPPDSAP